MGKIDPTFKPVLNEEVDEGWGKNLAAGALMTAASLGGTPSHAQTYAQPQDNTKKTEIIKQSQGTNSTITPPGGKDLPTGGDLPQIQSPEDVIQFAKAIISNNTNPVDVQNFFNVEKKQQFSELIKSNADWKNAFNEALNILYNYTRTGSEYQIFLKNDKAKELGKQMNINDNSTLKFENREEITKLFQKNGLKEMNDFVFMVISKGPNFSRGDSLYNAMDYINWSTR